MVYAAAQFFAAPLFGKPGDRYGRRPVLLVSILGAAIGYVILGIGGALWVLLFARLIGGITAGNLSTASAYIADISDLKDRAKNFGFIGVAWGVGLIAGPALGNFAFNGINSTQTLFLIDKFAIQPWQLGSLMMVGGITAAVVQAVLVQRLVSRYREKAVAVTSLIGQIFTALAVFFAPAFRLIYPLTVLNSTLSTFTFPTIGTLASNSVSLREQGILMGVTTALGSLMSVVGPLCAGVIYDRVMRGAPYWMGAVIFALAAFGLYRWHPNEVQVASFQGQLLD